MHRIIKHKLLSRRLNEPSLVKLVKLYLQISETTNLLYQSPR